MTRIIGSPQSKRRHWTVLGLFIAALTLSVFYISGAQAVHDEGLFELGPTSTACGTSPVGTGCTAATATNIVGDSAVAGPDWGDLFDASGNRITGALGTFGGLADAFIGDASSAGGATDPSTFSGFGTSNKNVDPISTADCTAPGNTYPGCTPWGWDPGNIPAKDDLTNVYAYEAVAPTTPGGSDTIQANDLILYAGAEREDASGDSHIDFEFFQNQVSTCTPVAPATSCSTFVGTRKNGDVILSMDFLQGGGLGSVTVRKWNGSDYVLEGTAAGVGCVTNDTICAFNNEVSIDGGPWPNLDNHGKVITNLDTNAFTEIGVDLTQLIGSSPCLSTFMAKTRSSGSFTSELKDFAGPTSFAPCKPSTLLSVDTTTKTIHSGDSVTLTFSEKNNGNEALSSPTVSANNGCTPSYSSGDANNNGKLDTTETWVFTCTISNVTANTTITAWGSGIGVLSGILVTGNPTCTASSTVICSADERTSTAITVIAPATFLLKKAQVNITYTYYEKNTGNDPLTAVSVHDDSCPTGGGDATPVLGADATHNVGDLNNDGKLDPGEIWKFQCTASSTEGVDYNVTNTATGHGTDSLNTAVPVAHESDSATVTVSHAAPNVFP